ncbi:MAG TPA: hypothetical protein VNO30_24365 [Kofleriaceae bacterium]|nr:hypothetical protein [Kofleriaceae bacterium]
MRPVHRLMIRSVGRTRALCLEPYGMELALAPGDELLVELTGVDPPMLDVEDGRLTCWSGVGSELRVLRGPEELYSTVGNPVPGVPAGMSVREFLDVVGLKKSRDD